MGRPPKSKIECYSDHDESGEWILVIEKDKGKLTLEEIKKAAREHEWDYYFLFVDCYHEEYDVQYFWNTEDIEGDRVILYRAMRMLKYLDNDEKYW